MELREAFNDYAELTVGFTSTYPNRTKARFWQQCMEMKIEKEFGPETRAMIVGLSIMCGGVDDDIGDIVDYVLKQAASYAKLWPTTAEYIEHMKYDTLRTAALDVREAYLNSDGTFRANCTAAQETFGGSLAEWESFGHSCDNIEVDIDNMVRRLEFFKSMVPE